MKAPEFREKYGDEADYWGEDEEFPVDDWIDLVVNDATRLGYWDWVEEEKAKD